MRRGHSLESLAWSRRSRPVSVRVFGAKLREAPRLERLSCAADRLEDVMQLVYNGGLCGRSDRPCLNPSEVQAQGTTVTVHSR